MVTFLSIYFLQILLHSFTRVLSLILQQFSWICKGQLHHTLTYHLMYSPFSHATMLVSGVALSNPNFSLSHSSIWVSICNTLVSCSLFIMFVFVLLLFQLHSRLSDFPKTDKELFSLPTAAYNYNILYM
jgi:hypothetical protein